ncbi:MAG: AzlC family ABC transporter permease [Selenomonadaceae bacterium]|nr:AzlC family ABC transporter permease [Selenomonadaceae bacterium]MBR1858872.1 AzlC family ABC transporter permease [Selenomonadaceae bacterium]
MSNGFLINHRQALSEGLRDGVPIGLGYFVVSFTLGIAAKHAGLTPFQGFITSFFNNASAGEYAAFTVIAADASYLEMALITLVANARYMLMSTVLSQKFSPDTPFYHRIFVGFDVTDEIFGITVARSGKLNPFYNYGAMLVALPGWSIGTALGIMAGNVLPASAVSALSVALYGMFLAIIIPPSKEDRNVAITVVAGFILSFIAAEFFSDISAGTRTIILTVLIAGAAAVIYPVKNKS